MARQVLPVVGAIVGAYFGGAQGAQWGWAIGSVIGNAIDPLVIKGPSIGDIAQQTSQEGVPRPIVFALSQPIAGNIVACANPVIVKKRKTQGKGGPKVETQSVYRTYAIAVCEGPITAFIRVWRNGSLVYDVRPGGQSGNNSKFLQYARFFLGGFDQMPSPDLEAKFGAGNVPAMRGTAYLVMADEDLTDLQGAVPQYVFQVMRCEGMYLTSRPYAIESQDEIQSSAAIKMVRKELQPNVTGDAILPAVELLAFDVYGGAQAYSYTDTDQVNPSIAPVSFDLYGGQVTYSVPEDFIAPSIAPVSFDLYGGQVTYSVPEESVTPSASVQAITLVTV